MIHKTPWFEVYREMIAYFVGLDIETHKACSKGRDHFLLYSVMITVCLNCRVFNSISQSVA